MTLRILRFELYEDSCILFLLSLVCMGNSHRSIWHGTFELLVVLKKRAMVAVLLTLLMEMVCLMILD